MVILLQPLLVFRWKLDQNVVNALLICLRCRVSTVLRRLLLDRSTSLDSITPKPVLYGRWVPEKWMPAWVGVPDHVVVEWGTLGLDRSLQAARGRVSGAVAGAIRVGPCSCPVCRPGETEVDCRRQLGGQQRWEPCLRDQKELSFLSYSAHVGQNTEQILTVGKWDEFANCTG